MELNELREPVRRNLVTNDIRVLDILAVGHNLIRAYETQNWQRVHKKMAYFVDSYNNLIEDLNKKETPIEDKIIELEQEIEDLKKSSN